MPGPIADLPPAAREQDLAAEFEVEVDGVKRKFDLRGLPAFLTATGAPADETGVDGDFAYDPFTKLIYGPKAGTWPTGTSLVGATGSRGPKGDKGDTGRPGDPAANYCIPFFHQAQAESLRNNPGSTPGTFAFLTSADADALGDRVIPAAAWQDGAALEIETFLEYHLASGSTLTLKVVLCDASCNEISVLYHRDFRRPDDHDILILKFTIGTEAGSDPGVQGHSIQGRAVWAGAMDRNVQFVDAQVSGEAGLIAIMAAWDVAEDESYVRAGNTRMSYLRPVTALSPVMNRRVAVP